MVDLGLPIEKFTSCVVVLSGGQDSVTCLGVALEAFDEVHAIGFSYGQKHETELTQAKLICERHGVPFEVHSIPSLSALNDSALIGEGDVNEAHHRNASLPASFVPNRNALFLTISHAYAQKVGAPVIMTGVCQTDYSGYPDCREQFIKALEGTLNLGYDTDISIVTPLMNLNKAETFLLAESCGFLETVVNDSHTCYNGDRDHSHVWGKGCGKCPACDLRRKGYDQYVDWKDNDLV